MSLINDALKRAQQAQDKQPPGQPPGQPLRLAPAEPSSSRLWPVALVCLLLAVVVSAGGIWYLHKTQPGLFHSLKQAVQGAVNTTPVPLKPTIIIMPPVKQTPAAPAQPPAAAPAPYVVQPLTPYVPPPPAPVSDSSAAAAMPPNLTLQGVLYRPDRPAAIINGRTVYVGDQVGDGNGVGIIKSITTDTVTVLWAGQLIQLHL
jgi:biotin carboxyl carrier protein